MQRRGGVPLQRLVPDLLETLFDGHHEHVFLADMLILLEPVEAQRVTDCEASSRNSLRTTARALPTFLRSERETALPSATGRNARRALQFLRR